MNRELMARQMFANGGAAGSEEGGGPNPYELSPEELQQLKDQLYDMESGRVLEPDYQNLSDRYPVLSDIYPVLPSIRYEQLTPIYYDSNGNRVLRKPISQRVDEALRMLRMKDQINAYPRGLSEQEMQMIKDRNYAYGGPVYKMQEGGVPPVNPMAGMPVSPDAAMPPMAGAAGVDPAMMEQMLMQAQQNITALDDAETAEEVMNAMRGDQATIEERRMELAQIVGEGDAQSTPESVLTLVQPVMMMAQVDQGIGGLAQDQMNQPVTGDMAGGIMSTVDMGAEEGPAPVNFKYGGVVGMAMGGDPFTAPPANTLKSPLQKEYELQRDFYGQLLNKDAQTRALQGQQDLTKAQMLFDLAQTGLAIAAPGPRTMSVAEKLAYAAQQSQLFPKIGERAAGLEAFKQKQLEQQQQIDLAAAKGAMGLRESEEKARIESKYRKPDKQTYMPMNAVLPDGTVYTFDGNSALERSAALTLQSTQGAQIYKVGTEKDTKESKKDSFQIFVDGAAVDFVVGESAAESTIDALREENPNSKILAYKVGTQPSESTAKKNMARILLDGVEVALLDLDTEMGKYQKIKEENPDKNIETVSISAATTPDQRTVDFYDIYDVGNDRLIKSGVDAKSVAGYELISNLKPGQQIFKTGTYGKKGSSAANLKEIRNKDGGLVSVVDAGSNEGAKEISEAASRGFEVFNLGVYSSSRDSEPSTKLVSNTRPINFKGSSLVAGTPFYASDAEIAKLKKDYGLDIIGKAPDAPDMFAKGDAGNALRYFSTGELENGTKAIEAYANGANDPVMDSQIAIYTSPVPDARGFMQKRVLPDFVKEAIKKRLLNNPNLKSPVPLNTLGLTEEERLVLAPNQDVDLIKPDGSINIERATADPAFIISGLDYTRSQGFVSSLNRFFNTLAGQFSEIGVGPGYAGNSGKLTQKADAELQALARKTINVARAGVDGRVFALDLELLQEEVNKFTPGGFKTDAQALEQLRVVRSQLASEYATAKFIVDSATEEPGAFPETMVATAKLAMRNTEKLIGEYTGAILSYEANITGRGSSVQSKKSSVTRRLPRESNAEKVR